MADTTFATVLPALKAHDNGDGTYSMVVSLPDGSIVPAKIVLADGKILIGDAGNHAAAQTLGGDALLSNAGVLTLGNNIWWELFKRDNVHYINNWSGAVTPTTSGGTAGTAAINRLDVYTGTTASMWAVLDAYFDGTALSGVATRVNFALDFELIADLWISNCDANSSMYFYFGNIGAITTHAKLAARGMGLNFTAGYAPTLMTHNGTTLTETAACAALTVATPYRLRFKHTAGSRVDVWINEVLKLSQTNSTLIPTGTTAADFRIILSVANGNPGAQCRFRISNVAMRSPKFW